MAYYLEGIRLLVVRVEINEEANYIPEGRWGGGGHNAREDERGFAKRLIKQTKMTEED